MEANIQQVGINKVVIEIFDEQHKLNESMERRIEVTLP